MTIHEWVDLRGVPAIAGKLGIGAYIVHQWSEGSAYYLLDMKPAIIKHWPEDARVISWPQLR